MAAAPAAGPRRGRGWGGWGGDGGPLRQGRIWGRGVLGELGGPGGSARHPQTLSSALPSQAAVLSRFSGSWGLPAAPGPVRAEDGGVLRPASRKRRAWFGFLGEMLPFKPSPAERKRPAQGLGLQPALPTARVSRASGRLLSRRGSRGISAPVSPGRGQRSPPRRQGGREASPAAGTPRSSPGRGPLGISGIPQTVRSIF